jgi:formylglycine-generating enzyme required for sulfatase activity
MGFRTDMSPPYEKEAPDWVKTLYKRMDMPATVQADEFIAALNQLTGKKYRLPTEMEWEYAASGGNRSKGYKYSGGNNLNDVAWYAKNSYFHWVVKHYNDFHDIWETYKGDEEILRPVGEKLPNELGIYDMSGNVAEQCQEGVYKGGSSNDKDKEIFLIKSKHKPLSLFEGFRLVLDAE